ncbi:MAG: DNA repair protein RecO [Firmicutes bacterium]|nr:DNA repair protein RecO [Bacillota bacterium]
MASYRDDVLVLKRRPYRDHDALLTLFSRQHGKIAAVAKGVRRPQHKMAGALQPLSWSEVALYHGRSTLDTVTEAQLRQGYWRIAEELERFSWALVLVDVLDQLWPEREPSPTSFDWMAGAMEALHAGRSPSSVGLAAGFRLLSIAGFLPDMERCSACETALTAGPVTMDVADGQVLCPACGVSQGAAQRIRLGSLRSLQYWLKDQPQRLGRAVVTGPMKGELQHLFFQYVLHVTAKPLKSYQFLQNLDRMAHGPEGGKHTDY